MSKLRVHNLSVSLDGYAAGPHQSLEHPLGLGGEQIHEWAFAAAAWRAMHGLDGGERGPDDAYIVAGDDGIGATLMGRNMFGPVRGPWGDEDWRGWWGDNPVYHHPVFVLTHHARDPLEMQGGTTFYFVTEGIDAAVDQAFAAAGGLDVRVGGGADTIRQLLRARRIDEMDVAIAPVLLGSGERLLDDLGGAIEGYRCTEIVGTGRVAHARLVRADAE